MTTTNEKAPTKTTTERGIIEFVPHGSDDKIKLSIEMVKRLVAVKTRSGKTCSDEEAFKFMLMCQARRLNPFEGDAFLIGYDSQAGPTFSLITAHQAFLKRAETHPEFDGMDSGVIVLREGKMLDLLGDFHLPQDQIMGGWATVFFKHRTHPMQKRLRVSRFNKGFGVWKDDPAGMIVKCAEADALRSSFPTQLGGMYIEQEMTAKTEIATPVFAESKTNGGQDFSVSQEPVVTAAPEPTPEPTPVEQSAEPKKKAESPESSAPKTAASASDPKKKAESSGSTDTNGPSTSKRRLKAKAPSVRRSTKHEELQGKLAVGGFGPTDLIAVAVENGWISVEETFEKLSDEKCAEFLDPDNWPVIMELLEKKGAPAQ